MKAVKAEKTKKELIVDGKNVLKPVDFNKNKKTGVERVQIGDKVLFEGTV